MSNGVPDALSYSRLSRAVSQVKTSAERARLETTTGLYEDVTKANKGDIGGVQLVQKALNDAQGYQRNLDLAANRATRTQAVLGSLTADTSRIATGVVTALGVEAETTLENYAEDARATLSLIFSNLNTDAGGRALFGGDETDSAPLANVETLLSDIQALLAGAADAAAAETALDAYFDDPAGGFATTIYVGGAGDAPGVEISTGARINASVKADAQPIKDLIRSLAVIANYETLPSGSPDARDAVVEAAAGLAIDAETRLIELRAEVGVAEARIADRKAQYEAEESALTELLASKVVRDPYEAASELQLLESQLEASYLMSARLSRLSLANYL